METRTQTQDKPVQAAAKLDTTFDFEQWAVQVRQQMIASLQKRGSR